MSSRGNIVVKGARVHNLRNIDVTIPRNKLTVITGLSGSGKSSLAFDTIFAEGQRRYIDTFSSYARGYIGNIERPDVDQITGLSPVISIDQKTTSKNPRSTVGTITEVYDYLRLLFARASIAHSYITGKPMVQYTDEQICELVMREYAGEKILILAPLVQNRKGHYKELFETIRKKGYIYVRVDGEVQELVQGMKVDRYQNHSIEVVVDRVKTPSESPLKGEEVHRVKTPSESPLKGEEVHSAKCNEESEGEEFRRRLRQSVDKAMVQGNGLMGVIKTPSSSPLKGENRRERKEGTEGIESKEDVRWFSRTLMDAETGLSYPEPAPHTFSFNSPSGWCPCCRGLGRIKTSDPYSASGTLSPKGAREDAREEALDEAIHDEENWWEKLQQEVQNAKSIVQNEGHSAKGIVHSEEALDEAEEEEAYVVCPECKGQRLSKISLSYTFAGKNIAELSAMDLGELREWLRPLSSQPPFPKRGKEEEDEDGSNGLKGLSGLKGEEGAEQLSAVQMAVAEPILKEIGKRLDFMLSVGLNYLSLSRGSESLSGGESQRIRLATQIGSRLVNVLYILDEPSIGLHQRDNERLIRSLKELRDMGNSVIVVEHDEDMMRQADWIVDIGPGAGRLGGQVVFQGTVEEMLKADTLTARYLKGKPLSGSPLKGKEGIEGKESKEGKERKEGDACLVLRGCTGNNLKDVTVEIPLGKMICVTGVSGSGKSTLINQTLYPILSQRFYRSKVAPLPYKECGVHSAKCIVDVEEKEFAKWIDKVINVNQAPIGRTPRSNPATYTDVFTDIRNLFAQMPEAKIRNWKAGRFSFNTAGGRCEECAGNGVKTIKMHFMPDVIVDCECCGGMRYNRETMEVKFKGKSIGEVLNMTINQAVEFFDAQPHILRKIKTIQDVGLGYLKLGQPSTTLSGGESQRIKLATELAKPQTGRTLYILDEPTTGLHFEDIRILMGVLRQLVERGNTVLIIEHNLDVIRQCDHIIDLGPEGGREGGKIVATGTVEDIKNCPSSLTGRFL